MFDHIGIGVSDLAASRAFFLAALAPLGVEVAMEVPGAVSLGRDAHSALWLGNSPIKPAPLHLAFAADSREQVDEFYRRAIAAGGEDNGAPGLRPQYHEDYYAAFVIGPDGHNVEVVCRKPA